MTNACKVLKYQNVIERLEIYLEKDDLARNENPNSHTKKDGMRRHKVHETIRRLRRKFGSGL